MELSSNIRKLQAEPSSVSVETNTKCKYDSLVNEDMRFVLLFETEDFSYSPEMANKCQSSDTKPTCKTVVSLLVA